MTLTVKGPWTKQEIDSYLLGCTYPLRIACVGDDDFPRVVSVWFGYDGEQLRCVSHRSSQLVGLLEQSNRIGFEVATNSPPYFGVRGQGLASLGSDADGVVLTEMLQRYLGGTDSRLGKWLLSRAADEVLITIEPVRLFSWDYRDRMA